MKMKDFLYQILRVRHISLVKKRKFLSFGSESNIEKPYLQLSGLSRIKIGNNVTILKNCRMAVYGEGNNEALVIGNRCYIAFGFTALAYSDARIFIGDDVLVASNVLISSENHGINPKSYLPYMSQELTGKNVTIGDGCWIGEKVCILPGVSIGKKSVIGAGSVVTKSIPDYSIAVGNPARVIKRYNFDTNNWEIV